MDISLNGKDWSLSGWLPYSVKFNKESGIDFKVSHLIDRIGAEVPGSVQNDLLNAGIIEDPYFELNALKTEWIENKWWNYRKVFQLPDSLKGKKARLVFKGVDYRASFYLNDVKLGEHENMFTAVKFDITGLLRFDAENILEVVLEGIPEDQPQMGYTTKSRQQKSRFGYSWDFSTRLVNMGIWQDVDLQFYEDCLIGDVHILTDVEDGVGIVRINGSVEMEENKAAAVKLTLSKDGQLVKQAVCTASFSGGIGLFSTEFRIDNPLLWHTNGAGNQELYRLEVEVPGEDVPQDRKVFNVGIRKLEYEKNEGAPEGAMPFTARINGEKIYIKGVNLVPLDHMYGAVTKERYRHILEMVRLANANLVRIWGGGIIEKECFYNLCDELGIMVWQEFMQSNSGMDGIPCTESGFQKKLAEASAEAIKEKRNHVSLTFWSGGNELKNGDGSPVAFDNENIAMLKALVDRLDPQRLFYPSCPFGPNFSISVDEKSLMEMRNHNIHGFWAYLGVEKHYAFYNRSNAMYHGEFGVNGCSSAKALKKFMKPENLLRPMDASNVTWRFHGASWWDSLERETEIFGGQCAADLEKFALCSQFIQAEGVRYILESNRRRKYQNSGSMIWQFNEPWPNVNCTNLVDYYGGAKMVYYWTKKAYEPVHASLRYEKLNYVKGETFSAGVFINNSGGALDCSYTIELLEPGGNRIFIDKDSDRMPGNAVKKVKDICCKIKDDFPEIFFVRLCMFSSGEKVSENIYIFSTKSETIFESLLTIPGAKLEIRQDNAGETIVLSLKNTGTGVCVFANVTEETDLYYIYCKDNFLTIFPGESTEIQLKAVPKNALTEAGPQLSVKYLNQAG